MDLEVLRHQRTLERGKRVPMKLLVQEVLENYVTSNRGAIEAGRHAVEGADDQ